MKILKWVKENRIKSIVITVVIVTIIIFLYVIGQNVILKILGALGIAGISIGAIEKTTASLDIKIDNVNKKKKRIINEINKNNADDNYNFGVGVLKRRRNKARKK